MKLFFISLSLLFCAVFSKQIIGRATQLVLFYSADCQMGYRSIDWKDGELVFFDVILSNSTLHSHIESASLHFDWSSLPRKLKAHLTLNDPHVAVMKKPSLPESKDRWVDVTVSAINGTVDWDGAARFSFDQTHLLLDWGHSSAFLTFHKEGVDAELKQFRVSLLQPWVPAGQILDGRVTGRVTVGVDRTLGSAHLKMAQIALSHEQANVDGINGSVSYNSNLGLKWEFQGNGHAQDKNFPFSCRGRGFFKSHWIESEMQFEGASCALRGERSWEVECHTLRSEQVALLQAGSKLFFPELPAWSIKQGTVSLQGSYSPSAWDLRFETTDLALKNEQIELCFQKATGFLSEEGGELSIESNDLNMKVAGKWDDWKGDVRFHTAIFSLQGGWDGDKFPIQIDKGSVDDFDFCARGWVDPHFDFALTINGQWKVLQSQIPFSCAYFNKKGDAYSFDFRLERQTWDILRLKGTSNGKDVYFNNQCHILGAPLQFGPSMLGRFDVQFRLPWSSITATAPLLQQWGLDLAKIPFELDADVHFLYMENHSRVQASGTSLPFRLSAEQQGDLWEIDLDSELTLKGVYQTNGIAKGKGKWKTGLEVEFDGKLNSNFEGEFSLSKVFCDLSQFDYEKIEGILEGQGHLIYKGSIEADFDLHTSALKLNAHSVENEGPIHLSYSSTKGALFRGVNLHGPFDCIVDLLEYDLESSHWLFHNSQMHLPGSFLTHRFLKVLDPNLELNFTANLDFASDFSTFTCTMREGDIPLAGQSHYIENLKLNWDNGHCTADLTYLNFRNRLQLHIDDKVVGRLILGEEQTPLSIDWEYADSLTIHSVEGMFEGIEASFHAENPNVLVGSARLDIAALSKLLPVSLAEVFEELKMGKGYELKGRVSIENNLPKFAGILSGKGFELFGLQLRTLLSQIDLCSTCVHLYDMKISDTAGMMKVDQILIESQNDLPWTIEIPQITILDLRPSLFQKPGADKGKINPLVVRKLTLTDFHGLLDDRKTYTANGRLHFINSYKREDSVFDLPANVLSRIVGLDLDLLIPVCGDLSFELKDGLFTLNELTNSFSEGHRSEFFLEMEPAPFMDLDWNLQIAIRMKQFVLFKITESFMISIDGNLGDPQVHLKKKRFFGLL